MFSLVLFFYPLPTQKITGPHLLMLNEKALEAIGVHSEYRQQTILQAIEELKVKEYSAPRNLYEFKVHSGCCTVLHFIQLCCYFTILYSSVSMYFSYCSCFDKSAKLSNSFVFTCMPLIKNT